jgi:predicted transcriptional regulator of viral defense system
METKQIHQLIKNVDALLAEIKSEVDVNHGIVRQHARHDFMRKARVMDLAREMGGFVTVTDVEKSEQCDRQIARAALSSLSRSGLLERVYRGRYRVPAVEQKHT